MSRQKSASRGYALSSATILPAQSVVLTVTSNKEQLINLIVQDLIEHKVEVQGQRLVITGSDPVPVEVSSGRVIPRPDLRTTHEEADTIIVQQVSHMHKGNALVVADDTDIFTLLVHFCHHGVITCRVLMQASGGGRSVIDNNASAEKHKDIIPDLLGAHTITGCDTVAATFGIGKLTGIKVLKKGQQPLNQLGNLEGSIEDALDQATKFILACYGHTACANLTEARQKVWIDKVGRSKAAAPDLKSLPPTTEAFKQNALRAHLQLAIWRHAVNADPPDLHPSSYGWSKVEGSTSVIPTTVADDVVLVPDELLKVIRCSCSSDIACKSSRCSCTSASLLCSVFCVCRGGQSCKNYKNMEQREDEDDDD